MPPAITLTCGHAALLREAGPGALLVWGESSRRLGTVDARETARLGADTMIIAGYEQLGFLGLEADPAAADPFALPAPLLAFGLQELADDACDQWPLVRALTPGAHPLRAALADWGLVLGRTVVAWQTRAAGLPQLLEIYVHPASGARAEISSPLGYADPVQVRLTSARGRKHTFALDASALGVRAGAQALSGALRRLALD